MVGGQYTNRFEYFVVDLHSSLSSTFSNLHFYLIAVCNHHHYIIDWSHASPPNTRFGFHADSDADFEIRFLNRPRR